MKLHNVITPSYLIVDPDSSIVDLAYLLGLDVDVDLSHDHFHIHSDAKHKFQALTSYRSPTLRDVRVSPEVFSKILIDVASGMSVITAFEKQGYTYENDQSTLL